eukprot:TRINITY_DN25823_c0_g1_i1.p1 TRINITY_DN25823_c0_g1~~TRINITY_DN25823_c0_g1_i1.p1  ORF type:complete len:1592 (+),score=460.64 TRINITY_DN25823_c0_g1_i1:38-4777(+)
MAALLAAPDDDAGNAGMCLGDLLQSLDAEDTVANTGGATCCDDDMSDDDDCEDAAMPQSAGLAEKPAAFSEEVLCRMPAVAQIAARKAKVAELKALKQSLVENEDYEGAQEVKEQINQQELALEASRRGRLMRTLPTPMRETHADVKIADDYTEAAEEPTSKEITGLTQEEQPKEFSEQQGVENKVAAVEAPDNSADEEAQKGKGSGEAEESRTNEQDDEMPDKETSIEQWCDSTSKDFVQLTKIGDEELPSYQLPRDIYERLYPYQCEGVAWLARLWQKQQGGILADEMGLGKTVQICAFLNGARKAGATHAIVLLPVTLLEQWGREAKIWCPGWPVYVYYGGAAQRAEALRGVSMPQGGILLTSYSMLSSTDSLFDVKISEAQASSTSAGKGAKRRRIGNSTEVNETPLGLEAPGALSKPGDIRPWDVVVCDEAHRMKSISSLFSKSLRAVRSRCRLLLTGTPVQNALQDLWALMDYAMPGLLGNHATFIKHFSDPIDRGSVRGASAFAVALKDHLAGDLRGRIAPHLLRRTKVSSGLVLEGAASKDAAPDVALDEAIAALGSEFKSLPLKRETIVWLLPSEEQMAVHRKVLDGSKVVQEAAQKSKLGIEVFQAIGLMKRLSNHPLLVLPMPKANDWKEVLTKATETLPETGDDKMEPSTALPDVLPQAAIGGDGTAEVTDDARAGRAAEMLVRKLPRDADSLLSQSAKLRCMALLMPSLVARGHRVLVFSQSVKMLDLIQICVLKPHGLRCLRIDGQTDAHLRAEKVRKFQEQRDRFHCMLLTTSVGGVGLNLTSADRVIIVDPAWNPATDMQAVDRAYRIGQDKEVRTYRLVTSGSIEDKMFRLQVFKMGLTKTALEGEKQSRYFTAKEIRELFEWTDPAQGETRQLILDKHGPESEQPVLEAASEDGAVEAGWLGDWITAGVSDFGSLMGGFSKKDEEETETKGEEGVAKKIEEAKQKLEDAEAQSRTAAEARFAAKLRIETAERRIDDAKAAIELANGEAKATEKIVQEKNALLVQARRAESMAAKHLERMLSVRNQQQKKWDVVNATYWEAELAAKAFAKGGDNAGKTARSAEDGLSKAIADAERVLKAVDDNGRAAKGKSCDASPDKLKKVRKALDRVRQVLDRMAICQAELEDVEEECMAKEAEADSAAEALEEGSSEGTRGSSVADYLKLVARARDLENERDVLQEHLAKEQKRANAARDAVTSAVSALVEAGMAFADSFEKAQAKSVTQADVKAAQGAAKLTFRTFMPMWSSSRKAQETRLKAVIERKRAAEQLESASAPRAEAEAELATAKQWHDEAAAEHEAKLEALKACQAEASSAEAVKKDADSKVAALKQKYEEMKKEHLDAKGALKPMRVAEKAAKVGRQAVIKELQKVEKAKLKVEEAKESALKKLTSEEYDAKQVEQAYEQKRKAAAETGEDEDAEPECKESADLLVPSRRLKAKTTLLDEEAPPEANKTALTKPSCRLVAKTSLKPCTALGRRRRTSKAAKHGPSVSIKRGRPKKAALDRRAGDGSAAPTEDGAETPKAANLPRVRPLRRISKAAEASQAAQGKRKKISLWSTTRRKAK